MKKIVLLLIFLSTLSFAGYQGSADGNDIDTIKDMHETGLNSTDVASSIKKANDISSTAVEIDRNTTFVQTILGAGLTEQSIIDKVNEVGGGSGSTTLEALGISKSGTEINNTVDKAYNTYHSSVQNANDDYLNAVKQEYPAAANLISAIQAGGSGDGGTTIINGSGAPETSYFADFPQTEAGLQQWLDTGGDGKTLIGNGTTITVDSGSFSGFQLTLGDNVTIDFKGMTIKGTNSGGTYLRSEPSWFSPGATLLNNITAGDTSVTLTSGGGSKFAAGDFLYVNSSEVFAGDPANQIPYPYYSYEKGEFATVIKISGDTVHLDRPLYYSNNKSNVTIQKIVPRKNVVIKNLNIEAESNDKIGFAINGLYNYEISGFNINNSLYGKRGIINKYSSKGYIHHNVVRKANHNYTGDGYGIYVGGNDIDVFYNTVTESRHDITTGDRAMLSRNIRFNYNFTGLSYNRSNDFGSIDLHNNTVDVEIIGNFIYKASGAINVRNNGRTKVHGNHIVESYGGAIYLYTIESYVDGQYTLQDVSIKDNILIDCGLGAKRSQIIIYNSSTTNNQLPISSLSILNNIIRGGEATQSYAILFPSDAVASKYEFIDISGNHFINVPNMIKNPQNARILNNIFKGRADSYYFIKSDNNNMAKVVLMGNIYEKNGGSPTAIHFQKGTSNNLIKNEVFINFGGVNISNTIGATVVGSESL